MTPLLGFVRALEPDQRSAFAAEVGTTVVYLYQLAGHPACAGSYRQGAAGDVWLSFVRKYDDSDYPLHYEVRENPYDRLYGSEPTNDPIEPCDGGALVAVRAGSGKTSPPRWPQRDARLPTL